MLSIKEITETDIPEIAKLETEIFPDAWSEKGVSDTFFQSQAVIFGAWREDTLIGYVILYYAADEGEIARIAVAGDYRREGTAGALLSKVVEFCRGKGVLRLFLEVRESNAPAEGFYKKHGFTEDGIRKQYYANPTEDARLMSRILSR